MSLQVTLVSHYAVRKSWILRAFSGDGTVTWMMASGKERRNIIMLNGCQAEKYKLYCGDGKHYFSLPDEFISQQMVCGVVVLLS